MAGTIIKSFIIYKEFHNSSNNGVSRATVYQRIVKKPQHVPGPESKNDKLISDDHHIDVQ